MEVSDDLWMIIQNNLGVVFVFLFTLLAVLGGLYWHLINKNAVEDEQSYPSVVDTPSFQKLTQSPQEPAPQLLTEKARYPKKEISLTNSPPVEALNYARVDELLLPESLSHVCELVKKNRLGNRQQHIQDELSVTIFSLIEAGKNAMNEQAWERAKVYFDEALKLQPANALIHMNSAIIDYELGNFSAAEQALCEAETLHPLAGKAFRAHLAFRV